MARYRITAKVPNLTTTIIGVTFVGSVAEMELTEDKVSTLAYFRRQGYEVIDIDEESKAAAAAERKAAKDAEADAKAKAKAEADATKAAAEAAKRGGN